MPDAPVDYTAQALRTESPITPALQTRLKDNARLVHAVLGLQTEASEPADRNGVVEYLAQHCDRIGPAIAGRLYDVFRGDAVKMLRLNPEEAARRVDRLGPKVATAAAHRLRELAATEETMIELTALFAGRGFPQVLTQQVFKVWGAQSASIIRHDPYQLLVRRFRGVDFARVDALYLALGKPPQKLRRQVVALWDLLDGNSDGHTYLRAADLERRLRQRIGGDRVRFANALRAGLRLKLFLVANTDGGPVVALRTQEIVPRLSQREFDLQRARDAAVRELQELRSQRDTLVAEVATLRQQLHESNSSEMLTSWPLAAVTEPLNHSTGTDGPGQS